MRSLIPNAPPPAGPQPAVPSTQTTTTTTTTTTNPDGSVTQQEESTSSVSCSAGNHDQRTFGSVLQDHMNQWQGSGLLSALNLLKTLTWPSAIPTYSLAVESLGQLHARLLGLVRHVDRAAIAHHRARGLRGLSHHLCGERMTALLNLIYCFLMDMIQSFRDIWIVGWDSVLSPVDALHRVGGDGRSHRADDCQRICLAARRHRHVASDRHYCGRDGGAVHSPNHSVCAVGVIADGRTARTSITVISQGASKCPADSGHQRWRCFTPVCECLAGSPALSVEMGGRRRM